MTLRILLALLLTNATMSASTIDVEWTKDTTSLFGNMKSYVTDEDLILANGRLYTFESSTPVYIEIKRKHPTTKDISVWRSHTASKSFQVGLSYRTKETTNTLTGGIFTYINDQVGFSDTHSTRVYGGAFPSEKSSPPYWTEKWFTEDTVEVGTEYSFFTADAINEWYVTIKFSNDLIEDENQ